MLVRKIGILFASRRIGLELAGRPQKKLYAQFSLTKSPFTSALFDSTASTTGHHVLDGSQLSQHSLSIDKNIDCVVSVVESEKEFDALEQGWNDVLGKADVSVFQTFEWQRSWWKYFHEKRRLHLVVFKQSDCIVGIAPMFLEDITLAGIRIATWLQFIGAEQSDYLQIIIAAGYEEVVLHAFVQHLCLNSERWDVLDIRDVSERFALLQALPTVLERSGFLVHKAIKNECPQVNLPDSWEEFAGSLTSNMRHNLKRKKERLEHSFNSEMEIFKNRDENIRMAIGEFAKLHTHRWKSLGYPSAFEQPSCVKFHFEVAEKFAQRGWLRIFFLKVNGMRVATSLDFNFRKRIYVYLCHADGPKEVMKLSPGYLLRCAAVRQGIAEGMRTYDFLRGNEKYKYQEFPCEKKENWSIRVVSPSRSGRLHFKIFHFGEFFVRSRKRIFKEYFDIKRYYIEHSPSMLEFGKYMMLRLWGLLLALCSSIFGDVPLN